jgi:hypothetical protein
MQPRIASLVKLARKPGLILAPDWKAAANELELPHDEMIREIALSINRPLALAFVSHNLYLGSANPRPVTGLIASVMYHGEVGIDKLAGFSCESEILKESEVIDLLPRKVKCIFEASETVVGAAKSNLLLHAKKFSGSRLVSMRLLLSSHRRGLSWCGSSDARWPSTPRRCYR